MILPDGFPGDRAFTAADEKAGEGAKFEEFERSASRDNISKLSSPARIAVPGELVAFGQRRRRCVGVGLLVVVVREVVESLEGVIREGVE